MRAWSSERVGLELTPKRRRSLFSEEKENKALFEERRKVRRNRRYIRARAMVSYDKDSFWFGAVRLVNYNPKGILCEVVGRQQTLPFSQGVQITLYFSPDSVHPQKYEVAGNIIRIHTEGRLCFAICPENLPVWLDSIS